MSVLGLQLRTPGNRSRFGTLTRSRRLSGNSMLRPSRGSNCPSPVRRNSNALTEVDAEPSLARFPIARSGMRRSRPQPDMTREASFAHTCTTGDCERPDSVSRKTRRRLHRRSPSSIKRCIFAHDAVTTSRRQRFSRSSSLEPRVHV